MLHFEERQQKEKENLEQLRKRTDRTKQEINERAKKEQERLDQMEKNTKEREFDLFKSSIMNQELQHEKDKLNNRYRKETADHILQLQEERALNDFKINKVENPYHFQFEVVEKLTAPTGELLAVYPDYRVYENKDERIRYIGLVENEWEQAYIRVVRNNKEHDVQLKAGEYANGIGVKTVLNSLETEHLIVEAGGVVLHASYIIHNGKAILFTAPSGTGKSTQAQLWEKHRQAQIINGDRAVVRVGDGQCMACGLPYSGSSHYCRNESAQLEAIVYLGQALKTDIKRLSGAIAFRKVWEGCSIAAWNREDTEKAINIVQTIVENIPVYQLECTPDISAVTALEKELYCL